MSSFINKAKDKLGEVLDKNSNKSDDPRSDNYGPHGTNTANKFDPQVDSDLDGRNNPSSRVGGYGDTQAPAHFGTTQDTGSFASSDTYGSSTNNPGYNDSRSSNTGPHSSNLLNKADPRVDSDADHRNDPTSRVGGVGSTQQYDDNYGRTGGATGLGSTDAGYGRTTGTETGFGRTTGTSYGDTDRDYARTTGNDTGYSETVSTGFGENTGTHHGGAAGYSGTTSAYDNPASTNAGPHRSNFANKLDPRTDSDRDNRNDPTSRVGGYGTQTDDFSSTTGGYGSGTQTDTYGSTTGGYGSGRTGGDTGYGTGTGTTTGVAGGYDDTPGSGNSRNTAGPHNSDMLNKLDPRVDSDLDGSKTYGGNQTYR